MQRVHIWMEVRGIVATPFFPWKLAQLRCFSGALESSKQSIDSILIAMGAVSAEALDEARKTAGLRSLAEHLLALHLVSEGRSARCVDDVP